MQSDNNDVSSPRNHARRQQNKQHRNNPAPHHYPDVLSDSAVPNVGTPKSRKSSKPTTNTDRQSSAPVHSHAHPQKGRPASAAATNGNLATPSKPTYAGAAFHASPAPSSLPVPKFFSKSVPGLESQPGLQARIEREGDKSDASDGGNHTPVPLSGLKSAKSPLDMFFHADKAERARKHNTNEQQLSPHMSRSQTPNKPREMFMLELDGTSSPAAARRETPPLNRLSSTPGDRPREPNLDEQHRAAQTQSLKSFLNITGSSSNGRPTDSPSQSPFTPLQRQETLQHNASLATPSAQTDQYHYGNRNLSPLFQAASRSPQPFMSPQHPMQQQHHHQHQQPLNVGSSNAPGMNNNGSVYANHQYAMSPSKYSSMGSPQAPQHYSPSQHDGRSPGPHHHQQQQHQHNVLSQQQENHGMGISDVRSMEERMKKMLNMS